MINTSKPTNSIGNASKPNMGITWATITTAWATETHTWAEASSLMANASRVTSSIINTPKP